MFRTGGPSTGGIVTNVSFNKDERSSEEGDKQCLSMKNRGIASKRRQPIFAVRGVRNDRLQRRLHPGVAVDFSSRMAKPTLKRCGPLPASGLFHDS